MANQSITKKQVEALTRILQYANIRLKRDIDSVEKFNLCEDFTTVLKLLLTLNIRLYCTPPIGGIETTDDYRNN